MKMVRWVLKRANTAVGFVGVVLSLYTFQQVRLFYLIGDYSSAGYLFFLGGILACLSSGVYILLSLRNRNYGDYMLIRVCCAAGLGLSFVMFMVGAAALSSSDLGNPAIVWSFELLLLVMVVFLISLKIVSRREKARGDWADRWKFS